VPFFYAIIFTEFLLAKLELNDKLVKELVEFAASAA